MRFEWIERAILAIFIWLSFRILKVTIGVVGKVDGILDWFVGIVVESNQVQRIRSGGKQRPMKLFELTNH